MKTCPGRPPRAREHVERRRLDPLPGAEQDARVEVPLHRALVPTARPAVVERDAPVEADRVAAGRGHLGEQAAVVPVPKWIVGTPAAASTRAEYGATNSS